MEGNIGGKIYVVSSYSLKNTKGILWKGMIDWDGLKTKLKTLASIIWFLNCNV